MQKERRSSPRHMCSELVHLNWQNPRGGRKSDVGLLEDVSPQGACVNLKAPMKVGDLVSVHTRGFDGDAEVAYCQPIEDGYQVGLEFLDGSGWNREKWRPKHLLENAGAYDSAA